MKYLSDLLNFMIPDVDVEVEIKKMKEDASRPEVVSIQKLDQLGDCFRSVERGELIKWAHFNLAAEEEDPISLTLDMVGWKPSIREIRWAENALKNFTKHRTSLWVSQVTGKGYVLDYNLKILFPIAYQYPCTKFESYNALILRQKSHHAKNKILFKMFGWTVVDLPPTQNEWFLNYDKGKNWQLWVNHFSAEHIRDHCNGKLLYEPGTWKNYAYAMTYNAECCMHLTIRLSNWLFGMIGSHFVDVPENRVKEYAPAAKAIIRSEVMSYALRDISPKEALYAKYGSIISHR